MPRPFLYVVLMVFAAVASAYGYRLYQDERCCESRSPAAISSEQMVPLSQNEPVAQLPSSRPAVLVE